jgi:uncharacterized protein (DUF362 family)
MPMTDQPMTRRDCIKRGAGAVLVAGAAAAGGWWLHDATGQRGLPGQTGGPGTLPRLKDFFAGIDLPPSNPRLSIATGGPNATAARAGAAGEPGIERLVRAALGGLDRDLGIKRFIKPGDIVLVKPNAGFDRPPPLGATTHPEVLRWVLRLCREAGAADLLVADNPIESPEACFAKSGLGRVADEEGARVVMPTEGEFAVVALRDGQPDAARGEALGRWPVLHAPLARATKLLGIAPVKDHNLCSASITLKNWYGLLGGRRNQFHQAIHEVISDLALAFSPTLVIADGTRVMLRNGPTGGRITDVAPGGVLGRPTVVAAVDPVACDAWCYEKLLGRDAGMLRYLELAQNKVEAGSHKARLAERNWRMYERQGQMVENNP